MLTKDELEGLRRKASQAAAVTDPYHECWDPDYAADVPRLLDEIEGQRGALCKRLGAEGPHEYTFVVSRFNERTSCDEDTFACKWCLRYEMRLR